MPAISFGGGQYLNIENAGDGLHPRSNFTIEALVTPLEAGENPSIFSRPISKKWEEPYVSYRLGFSATELIPEFELLFEGESTPLVLRSSKPVPLQRPTHLAGTYDGLKVRLFVDGELVKEIKKLGKTVQSLEPPTVGSRSSSDPGGYFVGLAHEIRAWNVARTPKEIDFWKFRILPLPAPPECQGLWQTEVGIGREQAFHLAAQGFSAQERAWASFITRYTTEYNRLAPAMLNSEARTRFASAISSCVLVKARDGYLAIYHSSTPPYIQADIPGTEESPTDGFFVFDTTETTLSQILQDGTGNGIKVAYPTPGSQTGDPWSEPEDIPNPSGAMIASDFCGSMATIPRIAITPEVLTEHDIVTGVKSSRLRILSPLASHNDDSVSRLFDWLFIDLWFGDISWDIAKATLSETLATADLVNLNQAAQLPLPRQQTLAIPPTDPLTAVEATIDEFEQLLERPDVDEVRDIQPFLADPKHWFLLSPGCRNVWQEKRLGNKYKVDYIVEEAQGTYVAIEIESPKKKAYKTGKVKDPYSDLTHAEQQVRDYCNYIDWNRDTVEREEGLAEIFKPRGVVVIGRRRDLSDDGARKLKERNADSARYSIMVYDDLIDQARSMIRRLRAITS